MAKIKSNFILDQFKIFLPDPLSPIERERNDELYALEVQLFLESIKEGIIVNFTSFIKNVLYNSSGFEKKISIERNALFLNFNFTKTLEYYYRVLPEQINYIHNSPFYSKEPIILGHSSSPDVDLLKEISPPEYLKSKEKEIWKYERHDKFPIFEAKRKLIEYYYKTLKPSEVIILKNEPFFSTLNNINCIYILGHSLSKIDIQYFEKILKSVSKHTFWNVSYYKDDDYSSHLNTLTSIGINSNKIKGFKISEFQISNE